MPAAGTVAADESVQTFYAVNQALFQQKIEGAVNGRGFGGRVDRFDLIEQVVGFDRLMAVPDQFQHLVTDGRELDATRHAKLFSRIDGVILALTVVVTTRVFGLAHGANAWNSGGSFTRWPAGWPLVAAGGGGLAADDGPLGEHCATA